MTLSAEEPLGMARFESDQSRRGPMTGEAVLAHGQRVWYEQRTQRLSAKTDAIRTSCKIIFSKQF